MFTANDWGRWLWSWAYSPINFTVISVDVSNLVAEENKLYLTLIENNNDNNLFVTVVYVTLLESC